MVGNSELSDRTGRGTGQAASCSGEFHVAVKVPASDVDEAQTRHLTHGYYAVTSYMDAQLGLILDALEKTGHADLFAWQFF